jgi:hypothetical protein
MDAYSMEVIARTKVEDAHRGAELLWLLRDVRPASHERSFWRRLPSLRRLRRLAHPAAVV